MLIGIQASWSVTACLWPLPVMWLWVSQGVGLTINRENWVRTSSASPAATDTNINQVPRELSWECKFTFMKLAEVCWSLPCIPKGAKSSRREREWGGKENKRKNRYDHPRLYDELVYNSLTGCWWGSRVVSQRLILSILRLILSIPSSSGGYVLMIIKELKSFFWWWF